MSDNNSSDLTITTDPDKTMPGPTWSEIGFEAAVEITDPTNWRINADSRLSDGEGSVIASTDEDAQEDMSESDLAKESSFEELARREWPDRFMAFSAADPGDF